MAFTRSTVTTAEYSGKDHLLCSCCLSTLSRSFGLNEGTAFIKSKEKETDVHFRYMKRAY